MKMQNNEMHGNRQEKLSLGFTLQVGADMPCLGDVEEDDGGVGTVPTERVDGEGEGEEELEESGDGTTGEDTGKRRRQPSQKMIEAMGMLKRRVPESPTQGKSFSV